MIQHRRITLQEIGLFVGRKCRNRRTADRQKHKNDEKRHGPLRATGPDSLPVPAAHSSRVYSNQTLPNSSFMFLQINSYEGWIC